MRRNVEDLHHTKNEESKNKADATGQSNNNKDDLTFTPTSSPIQIPTNSPSGVLINLPSYDSTSSLSFSPTDGKAIALEGAQDIITEINGKSNKSDTISSLSTDEVVGNDLMIMPLELAR